VAAALVAVVLAVVLIARSGGESTPRDLPEAGSAFGGGTTTEIAAPRTTVQDRGKGPRLKISAPLAAARLFMVGFAGQAADAPFFAHQSERGWGGVLFARGNFVDPGQLGVLTGQARASARAAGDELPLIAAAQLGGPDSAFPGVPPLVAQSATPRPEAAAKQASLAAARLRELSVNTTLAPAADLRASGGAWQDRGYSDDPAAAARAVRAAVRAYLRGGVAPVVGHFPGEGGASQDPSEGPATVGSSVDELRERDLKPFEAVARVAPAVVMSSAAYAGFDGVTPATLLPEAVQLLRDTGFRGVVVSGDLDAAASASGLSIGDAAVQALQAGCDLLLLPGDAKAQDQAWAAVVRAIRTGGVDRAQIARSLARVDAMKRRFARAPQ
jgi:beta-N-acetylhexosaminidase